MILQEEQWDKKKQSKAAAKAARKGRLDPDSELNRNAKDVMDERAKNKRKRRQVEQEEAETDDDADEYETVPGVEAEKPGEGLKKKAKTNEEVEGEDEKKKTGQASASNNKKQRKEDSDSNASEDEEEGQDDDAGESSAEAKASGASESAKTAKMTKSQLKMAAKKERARIKSAARKAKKAEVRLAATASSGGADQADAVSTSDKPKPTDRREEKVQEESESDNEDVGGRQVKGHQQQSRRRQKEQTEAGVEEGEEAKEKGKEGSQTRQDVAFEGMPDGDDASARSNPLSPIFDTIADATKTGTPDAASTSTSISSTIPPSEKPKHIKLPADMDAVRARLAAKIEALRAARKADGPDGKPIRTRQELIESRRAKQAQRKAHRQELRKQTRLEEQEKREHALASNSPSVMSPALELDESGSYAFGRVAFGDGSRLSHDLTYVLSGGKRRGPSDPKTALLKVQNQKARLQELDTDKREDIEEKEAWLTARRRAEGEKIRDDEAILKKAVKRKEVAKKKSEQAWKDRANGVATAQKERQKKREDNIRKRREDKVLGKAGKKKKAGGPKKARPGFEGSLGVGSRRK